MDVACQAPLSMGFPKQECWSGLPFLLQGIFLTWTTKSKMSKQMKSQTKETNQQRCPKYVIQIDQSKWWGEHYLVQILGLTNTLWWMDPSWGHRLIPFPHSLITLLLWLAAVWTHSGTVLLHHHLKHHERHCYWHFLLFDLFPAQNRLWVSDLLTCLKQ